MTGKLVASLRRHIVGLIGLGALDDSTDEALRDTFYLVGGWDFVHLYHMCCLQKQERSTVK
jgi:hypothetical protein